MKQSMQVLTSQETQEWYTPPWIINEIVKPLLGGWINTDPASPFPPVPWIDADQYYNADTDGLIHPWRGRVFVNPPFDETPKWLRKAEYEISTLNAQRIAFLVNQAPGYAWWERAIRIWPVMLFQERVKFYKKTQDGYCEAEAAAKKGQAIIFLHNGYLDTAPLGDFAARFGLAVDYSTKTVY